ncbi:MAG TPA: hypothetical protein VFV34_00455 [Blastocatellia bacterium]|nr:hypothetical protein [Blastocatellia bacterium]
MKNAGTRIKACTGGVIFIFTSAFFAQTLTVFGTLYAEEQQQKATPRLPWQISFSYDAVPPNPGAGAPQTIIRLLIKRDGSFSLKHSVTPFGHENGGTTERTGTLTEDEVRQVREVIEKGNIFAIQKARVSTGTAGTEDGWSGKLTLATDIEKKEIEFGTFRRYDEEGNSLMPIIASLTSFVYEKVQGKPRRM